MPKPKYIVVCEKCLVEQATGLTSYINVIEQLLLAQSFNTVIANPQFFPAFRLFVSAVWGREATDGDSDVFELDTRMFVTGVEHPKTIHVGETPFRTPNLRLNIQMPLLPPMPPGNGAVVIESRIRKKGILDWISQRYEIPVIVEAAP